MATFSTLGIGTGTDLNSILTKLMAVERTPIDALSTKISSTNTTISLYGTLKSKLDALVSAADTLRFPSRLSALTANSSNETVATATADFFAGAGSHSVQVVGLASAQRSHTAGYASNSTFGAGTITLTVGDPARTPTDYTINVTSGMNIGDIRNEINQKNAGVSASIITDGSGKQHLVLASTETGKEGTFSLVSDVVDLIDSTPIQALTNSSTAVDAEIIVDGVSVKSKTNEFSGFLSGLTFTAKAVGTATVTVGTDGTKIATALQNLVDSYNAAASLVKSNSGYNSDTKVAGAFNADTAARSVMDALSNARSTIPTELGSSSLKHLFEVGVSVDQNGQLSLDKTKLAQAVAASPTAVTDLVKAYGKSFSSAITSLESTNGAVSNKISGLNQLISSFNARKDALEIRIANIEKGYRRQFSALDSLMSSMQTTSSYLTQQLASMSSS